MQLPGDALGPLPELILKCLRPLTWAGLYAHLILLMLFFVTGDDWHEWLALVFCALAALHLRQCRWWFRGCSASTRPT